MVSSIWITSALKRIDACLLDPYRHTHSPSPTTHLVFMFGAWVTGFSFRPARSPLAQFGWLVYYYWSLSLTWTNRSRFSKVVSQVAVTELSGTAGLRARLRTHWVSWKICRDTSQTPSSTGRRLFDNNKPLRSIIVHIEYVYIID